MMLDLLVKRILFEKITETRLIYSLFYNLLCLHIQYLSTLKIIINFAYIYSIHPLSIL